MLVSWRARAQLLAYTATPLFLLLDAAPPAAARDLPVWVYERAVEAGGGEAAPPRVRLAPAAYTLATDDAERIGVDHMARVATDAAATAGSQG